MACSRCCRSIFETDWANRDPVSACEHLSGMPWVRSRTCVVAGVDSSARKYCKQRAETATLMLLRRVRLSSKQPAGNVQDNDDDYNLSVTCEELTPVCTKGLSHSPPSDAVVPKDVVI